MDSEIAADYCPDRVFRQKYDWPGRNFPEIYVVRV
jgi:hypothetical protein